MHDYSYKLSQRMEELDYSSGYISLCVQYAERLLNNNLPVIFDMEHLSLLLGLKKEYLQQLYVLSNDLYKEGKILKSNGDIRVINIPTEGLKYVQRWILDNILYKMHISQHATGFIPGLSIVSNATKHVNKDCVINLDIKDFFPSITIEHVHRIFRYYGYTSEIAHLLSRLCTYCDKLPQGAPTSPYISNIVCLKLDKRISSLCNKIGASYTRYADDITISGNMNASNYIELVCEIIKNENFTVNTDKTRIQYYFQRQQVTGLIVNTKISVPKKIKKYLRMQIYFCKKFGVNNHLKKLGILRANYKDYLYGLAMYVLMVEPEVGKKYLNEMADINWHY